MRQETSDQWANKQAYIRAARNLDKSADMQALGPRVRVIFAWAGALAVAWLLGAFTAAVLTVQLGWPPLAANGLAIALHAVFIILCHSLIHGLRKGTHEGFRWWNWTVGALLALVGVGVMLLAYARVSMFTEDLGWNPLMAKMFSIFLAFLEVVIGVMTAFVTTAAHLGAEPTGFIAHHTEQLKRAILDNPNPRSAWLTERDHAQSEIRDIENNPDLDYKQQREAKKPWEAWIKKLDKFDPGKARQDDFEDSPPSEKETVPADEA